MPKFEYKAMTNRGQIIKKKVTDTSKAACINKIKKSGMTPIYVKQVLEVTSSKATQELNQRKNLKSREQLKQEKETIAKLSKRRTQNDDIMKKLNSTVNFSVGGGKVASRDIRIFTQDFYLLKKAGFNNIQALHTVISNTENPHLKGILEDVLAGVEAGEFMHTTLEYYPTVFPFIYINMIKVGELSGTLEESLQQAVTYLEDKDTLTRKVKKILVPHLAMFIGLIVFTVVAVVIGVPMLEDLFAEMGNGEGASSIPAITLWFSAFCKGILSKWYIIVIVILALGLAFWQYISTPFGRYKFDKFKYKMPIFGKLIYSLDFSKLMQSVYLNMKNGMRIQDALDISKNVVKNTVMVSTIEAAINNIYAGNSWIEPFEASGFPTPMMNEMLKIGMQTDLTEMLEKLLEYIDVDIENNLEKIVKVLPEVSYVFVGSVLIFFVVVVLVPVMQVYMGGWMFDSFDI